MTTSSSSVPILGPVLYFTSTDGYSYDVDNRPLLHLDTNIQHINTSLVGIGYGEHASLGGGLLIPGRAVSLAPNGSVFYPIVSPNMNPIANIVGLVIGSTDAGLNRIIWSSKHLDCDVLGLSSMITDGHAPGEYLVTEINNSGIIRATATPNLTTQYVVGRIKLGSYIEVNTSTDLISGNVALTVGNAVKDNHANMFGLSRFRNLLMFIDAGEVPVQYSKKTSYMSDYFASIGLRNPLNAMLSTPDKSLILTGGADSTVYGTSLDNKVVKERYTHFLPEQVSCGISQSTWAPQVYGTSLLSHNTENYELQKIGAGLDYSTSGNIGLFKTFTVDKYYQYVKTTSAPLAGKVQATATVFNPLNSNSNEGGEATQFIVWDFYEYNSSTGLETGKHRVILNSASASQALSVSNNIFPPTLITF